MSGANLLTQISKKTELSLFFVPEFGIRQTEVLGTTSEDDALTLLKAQ